MKRDAHWIVLQTACMARGSEPKLANPQTTLTLWIGNQLGGMIGGTFRNG